MKLDLKEMINTMDRLAAFVAGDKSVSGILFNINDPKFGENILEVCYTNGQKSMSALVNIIEVEEGDLQGRSIVFDYSVLSRIFEVCKPSGRINVKDLQFKFCDNNIVKVHCTKAISEVRDGETVEREMSHIEQVIQWYEADGYKYKSLRMEDYYLMHRFTKKEIETRFNGVSPKPVSMEWWEEHRDEWQVSELHDILQRMTVESGRELYITPKNGIALVHNQSYSCCIPLSAEADRILNELYDERNGKALSDDIEVETVLKNRIIQSSLDTKLLSSIFGAIGDGIVYTSMSAMCTPSADGGEEYFVDDTKIVFLMEDNRFAFSVRNQRAVSGHMNGTLKARKRNYSRIMMNVHTDLVLSIIKGAKIANKSDKLLIGFKPSSDGKTADIVIVAKNTEKSTENVYTVKTVYTLDVDAVLLGIGISINTDLLIQAFDKCKTEYAAFDIAISSDDRKFLRVAEIDMNMRQIVDDKLGINKKDSGGWEDDETMKYRQSFLGFTTYLSVENAEIPQKFIK